MQAATRPTVPTSGARARRRRAFMLAVGAPSLLLAAACGSGTTTTGTAAAATGGTVTVTMTDFHLALDQQSLAPGTYTFHAVNAGQTQHSIELDGPGVADQQLPAVVQPGRSADLTATLGAGSYDLYCPVDGHRAMGMELHFVVGTAPTSGSGGSGGSGY